jgi:hypothetical protein
MCLYTAACGLDAPGDHRSSNRRKGRRDEAAESPINLESEYR